MAKRGRPKKILRPRSSMTFGAGVVGSKDGVAGETLAMVAIDDSTLVDAEVVQESGFSLRECSHQIDFKEEEVNHGKRWGNKVEDCKAFRSDPPRAWRKKPFQSVVSAVSSKGTADQNASEQTRGGDEHGLNPVLKKGSCERGGWQEVASKKQGKQLADSRRPDLIPREVQGQLSGVSYFDAIFPLEGSGLRDSRNNPELVDHDCRSMEYRIDATLKEIVERRLSLAAQFSQDAKMIIDGLTDQLRGLLKAKDEMYKQRLKGDWLKLVDREDREFFMMFYGAEADSLAYGCWCGGIGMILDELLI
ncbi:hypothetical protein Dimus_017543 [Dionaea muscipula]